MITFKTLLETVYEPKSGDEKNFKDKHVVAKYKTPYDTESQFTSTATKAKRKADYDSKEDEQVYEAAELHTKRADKEAVIVRAVDPNTGQSKARVVKRGTGEIKIGEAMDPVGKHDADIDNDGDVDKSDKYLIARRKAIGKAIRKEEVELDESRQLLAARKSAERAADQKVRVQKDDYNWGKMITVHDGIRKSFPLHPEHQEKIKNLKDGGSTTFTDETRRKVKAHREGDTVHLQHADSDKKTSVAHSHFTEEVEQIDELSPNTLHKYVKGAAASLAGNASAAGAASGAGKKPDSDIARYTKKRMSGIVSASGRLADKANAVSEESEQIDEISRDLARSYIRKVADKNNTGEASPKEVMKRSPGVALAGKKAYGIGGKARVNATEEVELDEISKKTLGSYINKASDDMAATSWTIAANDPLKPKVKNGFGRLSKRSKGIAKATDRLTKEDLDEAFKIGAMKLKDGSTVNLTRESVDAFNKLFNQLNSANKAKMEERMLSGKSGFQEILGFAENI